MLKINFNSVWYFEHPNFNIRLEMEGQPVKATDTVLLKH